MEETYEYLVHYYRRTCPAFDAGRGDTTTLEIDNVTCDRCRPVAAQVDALGAVSLVNDPGEGAYELQCALIKVALFVEEDGLPCWCAEVTLGASKHSDACLHARELTKGVSVHETTLDEQVYKRKPFVLPNECNCPHCGAEATQGVSQYMPAGAGLTHVAEKLMKCLKCEREFVMVLAFKENIAVQASVRWSEAE